MSPSGRPGARNSGAFVDTTISPTTNKSHLMCIVQACRNTKRKKNKTAQNDTNAKKRKRRIKIERTTVREFYTNCLSDATV